MDNQDHKTKTSDTDNAFTSIDPRIKDLKATEEVSELKNPSDEKPDLLKKRDEIESPKAEESSPVSKTEEVDANIHKHLPNVNRGRFDSSDEESVKSAPKQDYQPFPPQDSRNEPSFKRNKPDYENNIEYEIYFGELNFDATEEDIRRHFGPCGNITQVKLLYRPDGKSRGRGFIKFSDENSMRSALNLHDSDMMGRRIVVEVPANSSFKRPNSGGNFNNNSFNSNNTGGTNFGGFNNRPNASEESSSVIVRKLPFNLQEDELGRIFEDCGQMRKYKIMRNDNGQSKGFGFVDFDTVAEATNALSKNGILVNGRNITVDFSTPKDGNKPFGNFRGRGGFGQSRPQMGFRNNMGY